MTFVEGLPGAEGPIEPGVKSLLQCCIPAKPLETALEQLDAFLAEHKYVRRDIRSAYRYEPNDSDEEYPSEYLKNDVALVASSHKACFSVFITCPEWAQALNNSKIDSRKPWWKFW